ncbi:hypothetical protein Gpo141_00008470 [Globisporangium polare]
MAATARAMLLLLTLLLLSPQGASAHRLLRVKTDSIDVCTGVHEISAFVVAHCDSNAASDAKCVESFEEYARDSDVFDACEATADAAQESALLHFKEIYSSWQQTLICERFHASERKAAHECSGDNVHRPWNEATWPLFCHETFMSYRESRKDIDALCARTENSVAFWEGYADYIASPTCKQYYDFVRDAAKRGCGGDAQTTATCTKMFQWYREKQQSVEVECLELHNTKPFYRGFYRWKKHAGAHVL